MHYRNEYHKDVKALKNKSMEYKNYVNTDYSVPAAKYTRDTTIEIDHIDPDAKYTLDIDSDQMGQIGKIEDPMMVIQKSATEIVTCLEYALRAVKEYHWNTKKHSEHVVSNELKNLLYEYQDKFAEILLGIQSPDTKILIDPNVTYDLNCSNLVQLCISISNLVAGCYANLQDISVSNFNYVGILSEIETLMAGLSKLIYLARMD